MINKVNRSRLIMFCPFPNGTDIVSSANTSYYFAQALEQRIVAIGKFLANILFTIFCLTHSDQKSEK